MKELTYYKQKLEEERDTVIRDLGNIGVIKDKRHPTDWQATPGDVSGTRSDPNEVADKIEMYEGNNDLVQKLETQLETIDTALEKIKNNKFGTCERCGKEIERDRLEANPAAKTCKQHMNDK